MRSEAKPVHRTRVAVDAPVRESDGMAGKTTTWQEQFRAAADMHYQDGGEAMQAGKLTGMATFEVALRACDATRAVTAEHRLRETRRGVAYNIREVDVVSDPLRVWLVVETGVAI